MASQKNILNIIFATFAVMVLILSVISASPVPNESSTEGETVPSNREGRYYGGLANANAFASAQSTGLGYPGFGVGTANAVASASAGASGLGFGYPYGK